MAANANEFNLTISTPNGVVFNDRAVQISVRGIEGELAVLAGHIPFVTSIVPAECRLYLPNDSIMKFKCGRGLLSVTNENVTILTSSVEFGT